MTSADYRIESNHPLTNRLLPRLKLPKAFHDLSHAAAMAVKCVPNPFGDEVRVVHIPSGTIVFRAGVQDGAAGEGRRTSAGH